MHLMDIRGGREKGRASGEARSYCEKRLPVEEMFVETNGGWGDVWALQLETRRSRIEVCQQKILCTWSEADFQRRCCLPLVRVPRGVVDLFCRSVHRLPSFPLHSELLPYRPVSKRDWSGMDDFPFGSPAVHSRRSWNVQFAALSCVVAMRDLLSNKTVPLRTSEPRWLMLARIPIIPVLFDGSLAPKRMSEAEQMATVKQQFQNIMSNRKTYIHCAITHYAINQVALLRLLAPRSMAALGIFPAAVLVIVTVVTISPTTAASGIAVSDFYIRYAYVGGLENWQYWTGEVERRCRQLYQ
uniref:Uncharacterized protein n=1 Tax=Parascaris univalens TaxID=6257 RepID=A0A915BQP7_PARUN